MENLVRILRQMEQNKFSTNKMRRDECETLDSIQEPLSRKDCSISFPRINYEFHQEAQE